MKTVLNVRKAKFLLFIIKTQIVYSSLKLNTFIFTRVNYTAKHSEQHNNCLHNLCSCDIFFLFRVTFLI